MKCAFESGGRAGRRLGSAILIGSLHETSFPFSAFDTDVQLIIIATFYLGYPSLWGSCENCEGSSGSGGGRIIKDASPRASGSALEGTNSGGESEGGREI